jgi:flagellar protein FlgJ
MSIQDPAFRPETLPRSAVDFADLRGLRAQAAADSPAALEAVARQFEALFLNMMLDSMRAATVTSDLFGSGEMELYQQMFDRQVASGLADGGGLGLAQMIVEQLSRTLPGVAGGEGAGAAPGAQGPAASVETAGPDRPASPGEFIRQVLPHARRAAEALGVHPMALVAQAALETGWGGRLPRRADGEPSHNLFGLKATDGWTGGRAVARTLEYENGVAVQRREQFRAYDSVEQSFADYVRLIRDNPRYAGARSAGGDPLRYAAALQAAGYATDPGYADKIRAVLRRPEMAEAWASLAAAPAGTST